MKYRVLISPQAMGDVDRNANWWAEHHSVEQALRWANVVYDQLEALQAAGSPAQSSFENCLDTNTPGDRFLQLPQMMIDQLFAGGFGTDRQPNFVFSASVICR